MEAKTPFQPESAEAGRGRMRPHFKKSLRKLSPRAPIYEHAEYRPDPSNRAHQTHPPFLPMRHVSNHTIHRVSARAGTWAVACMAQRRRPGDWAVRSPLARPLGRQGISIPTQTLPSRMWLVVPSVLRDCQSSSVPPRPAPAASPVSGGCAAQDLACQFPTATPCRVELKVGRGWGSGG